MTEPSQKIIFAEEISIDPPDIFSTDRKTTENLFNYFRDNFLFKWKDRHNDCEDRANAACILLDEWKIMNYKAWVFGGNYIKKQGGYLYHFWNYHVAPMITYQDNGFKYFGIIDPSTQEGLCTPEKWALNVTAEGTAYYLFTTGDTYIFKPGKLDRKSWYKRNPQNYKWTIQGLAGINGVSSKGKAQITFGKHRLKQTERAFRMQKHQYPVIE